MLGWTRTGRSVSIGVGLALGLVVSLIAAMLLATRIEQSRHY
jgi:hypothetical protein